MNQDLLLAWIGIISGLAALVGGGEALVRGASRLATSLRVNPLVIGLTVVAFGTSAPELTVSVQSALAGNSDIAIGNVIGSNIFNVLFILGLSAIIVPLVVSSRLIRWDVPIMIGASLVTLGLGWDQQISRIEGMFLFGGIIGYTVWCIRSSRKERPEVKAEFAHEWQQNSPGSSTLVDIVLIVVGLIALGIGSRFLIYGAVLVAEDLGVSKLIIALTIVAAGTSVPEVVTSLVAAIRQERDIAVGNVVGSNIFNILCVLGLSSAISPNGITVSPNALEFDIPVMIVVAIACLPILFTGHVISRWEGGLFLFYYIAYTAYLVSSVTQHHLSEKLSVAMLYFVVPLTIVTLGIGVVRTLRQPAEVPDLE
ncbi:MAG: calcium/sodium antiporter [Pirellulales bacterium]